MSGMTASALTAESGAAQVPAPVLTPAPGRARRWLILLPLVVSLGATVLAMRRTSTTFDEIVLIAGGARGFRTGHFDLAPDHPPLMQYVYGLPAYLSHPRYPPERGFWGSRTRYNYARAFFWSVGNDPERLAFRSRLMAALLAGLLVLVTWAFARRACGDGPALLAGTLVAFLPDVLAHGGVAYNDVPMALTYLSTLWAVDAAARRPTLARGALAGLLAALAIGVKYSAVLIAPAALLLMVAEAWHRRGEGAWARRLGLAVLAALAAMYVGLVLLYRGDFLLQGLQLGIRQQVLHVDAVGGAPNYFLGMRNPRGWWYFFPVAFLFKTSAALHLLMLAAVLGFARVRLGGRRHEQPDLAHGAERAEGVDRQGEPEPEATSSPAPSGHLDRLLASPLRLPVLGGLVFGTALLQSHLDIGFRYALPVLPLLCMVTAVGVVRVWRAVSRPLPRFVLAGLVAWYVAAPLAVYPWFLSYVSEYGPGSDASYEVLGDSSIDWGQGLLALRDFMRTEHIPSVYLSYFGSGQPEGYGIAYVPLGSFFPLRPLPMPVPRPKWVVVSATNLQSAYFRADPFAHFRSSRPDRVLGGSLYLYRLHD